LETRLKAEREQRTRIVPNEFTFCGSLVTGASRFVSTVEIRLTTISFLASRPVPLYHRRFFLELVVCGKQINPAKDCPRGAPGELSWGPLPQPLPKLYDPTELPQLIEL
jgi:hypothetical protein